MIGRVAKPPPTLGRVPSMDSMDETPTEPLPITPAPAVTDVGPTRSPARPHRAWRLVAIAAGVALVPASIAVASAASGGDDRGANPASSSNSRQSDDATSTSTPTSVSTPDVTTPSTPDVTTPSTPDVTTPDVTVPAVTAPSATVSTLPDDHGGHGELEPGDDHGGHGEAELGDDHGGNSGSGSGGGGSSGHG